MIERDDPQDKALASLYREAAGEQPPAGLDARILAAARAAAVPPKVAPKSWLSRWKLPVALAATVLLTTTMTLLVQDEEAGRLATPDAGATRAPLPAKAEVPRPPAAQPAPVEAPVVAPAVAPKVAEARVKPTHKPVAVPAAAPEAPPSSKEEERAPSSMGSLAKEREIPAANASRVDAMRDQAAPAARSMAAPAAKRAEADERSPEQWLDEIRRLRRDGRIQEADVRLAEFRKRYPQYVLPDDLKQP